MRTIRVFLADESAIVRRSLRIILEAEAAIHVVGEAEDGIEAIKGIFNSRPDVVFLGARLPFLDGIEATKRLKRDLPEVKVVILALYRERELEALAAGASRFLLKDAPVGELLQAVDQTFG